MNLSDIRKKQWRWIAVAGAVGGGGLSATLVYLATAGTLAGASLGFLTGALLFGLLIVLIGSVNLKLNWLYKRVRAVESEIQASVNIRPLTGKIPIDTGGWSLPAETCERLVHEIMEREPHMVLECGSGASTALMAICLQTYDIEGQVLALDHEPQFARETRNLLARHGVENLATVVTAPLVTHVIEGNSAEWYDFAAEEHLEKPIDLLLVDGPPGPSGPMARWPAVPLLERHLASDGLILLDDGDRGDERAAAQDWAERLDAEASLCGQRRPYWVLSGWSI